MMTIRIDVNDDQIHYVDVVNTGSVNRDGKTRYAVKCDGQPLGNVVHRRSDGAFYLAIKALALASEYDRTKSDV